MTQENKELLLKDLCTRLPYGVRGEVKAYTVIPHKYGMDGFPLETTFDVDVELQRINVGNDEIFVSTFDDNEDLGNYIEEYQINGTPWTIEEFTPYLRPLSSMALEEFVYFMSIRGMNLKSHEIQEMMSQNFSHPNSTAIVNTFGRYSHNIDWLNKKMFDYRGLIEKGLALEAPKDMYK